MPLAGIGAGASSPKSLKINLARIQSVPFQPGSSSGTGRALGKGVADQAPEKKARHLDSNKFSTGSAAQEPPKEEVMNRKLFGALTIAVLALVMNVNAQDKARADVPFSFAVGDKALPAATYMVSELSSHAIVIRALGTNDSAIMQYHNAERLTNQSPKLVFHKYGDRYFLYQVWSGSSIGMELPTSKFEKELQTAANQSPAPQEVVVALR